MNQIIHSFLIGLNNVGWGFCSYALRMFVQSSVLVILLLIIDFMLRKKVRAVFRYCVWMLVFIKLILPPTLSLPTGIGYWCGSSLSPNKIISKPIVDNTSTAESATPDMSDGSEINTVPSQVRPSQISPANIAPAGSAVATLPSITWQAIVFLIWVIGVLVFSVLLIQRMFFVLGLIAQSAPAKGRLLETLKQCHQLVGIGRNIELKLSNNLQSPAVCGLVRPIILMPTYLLEELSNNKLRAVLIHELVHIKRYDLWINFAQTFLQIIYFYNPLVWIANAAVRRLREQAVDETVLVTLGTEAESYSNTLIDIAEMAFFKSNLGLRLIGVAESKKSLHRRIRHMLSRPIPKSANIGVLGLITIITLAAVLLPMAAAARDSRKEQPQFTAKLPNGVTVELVAVCKYEGASKEWWLPNGIPVEPDLKIRENKEYANEDRVGFVVRLNTDDFNLRSEISGVSRYAGMGLYDTNMKELHNCWAAVAKMSEDRDVTTVRLGAATGQWETIAEYDGGRNYVVNKEIVFSEPIESKQGTIIAVRGEWGFDGVRRVTAIDKEGNIHKGGWKGRSRGLKTLATTEFYGIIPDQIQKYQLQFRPYEHITFKNVSLKPGAKTKVQIETETADQKAAPAGESLQSLIDSARPNDTVTIPKGLYKEPIDINKSLTLKGESRAECVFEVTADRPAIFINTKSKGEVVVEDLTIKWQLATSNKGIERPFALGVKDTKAEIKNCSFLPLGNSQRSPVAVRADGFSNLNISRSRFEGFEYVICYGQGTKGKTTDCLIMNCGHQGIINYTGATLHVERNVITGSRYHAIRCTGGTLHVKDNLLINNANRGIYLGNRSGSGTISNNLIINNAVGIGAFASSKYEIQNNVIVDSSYSGIGMYKSCSLTIRDNIFLNNERGWVMFDKGEKGGNTSYRNTFWKNKTDDENFSKTGNSINADPGFMDPDNGDFSLKPGSAKENKQGLTNPQLFKNLWEIWKNREDKNVPFTK